MYSMGTRVRINIASRFAYQCTDVGTIMSYTKYSDNQLWYKVEFDNGYRNDYQYHDLDIVISDNEGLIHLLPRWEEQ